MNHFVFVVCGDKEHTDKLNFSLKFLRHFSKADILVVTDTTRNENKIEHDRIIDIKTPEKFTHHQASIFLKTGLIKYLPDMHEDKFCYLDSDVVAVSSMVDEVFHFDPSPVLFARDHCPFNEFSPHAMNCGCLSQYKIIKAGFNNAMKAYFGDYEPGTTESIKNLNQLNSIFNKYKKQPVKHVLKILRYLLMRYLSPTKKIRLEEFTFHKHNKCWYNKAGKMISFDYRYHRTKLLNQKGIYYKNKNWYNLNDQNITPRKPECLHLQEYIAANYNINIHEKWNHWNGGVFLFDRHAKSFLNYWQKISIEEFQNKNTLTRDQFTLAISAWKFGLQNLKTLPVKFNFITEYANPDIRWSPAAGYTDDGFKTTFHPAFLHIYHHWGDTDWSIWQSVIKTGKENGIIAN
jgi:hypothetical protein